MIKNLQALHAAVAATAPIDGVSGDGTIWFQAGATPAQKAAAQAAAAAFVDPALSPGDIQSKVPPPLQQLPRPKSITEM
jgi:hypothetical protein